MKKVGLCSALLVLVFALSMTLAFSGSVFAYSKEKPMVIKCAIDNPPKDIKARTIRKLGEQVTEKTGGRVVFKYFYGASLIKKPAFVDGVGRGIADISTGPISFVTGKIPALSPFEIYGAYDLSKKLEMSKEVQPLLIEVFKEKKVYPLMQQFTGNCIFTHKEKFLNTPSDWKGAKMRLAGRWQSTLGKMWGASPVFLPPPELYLACQRGVIDGFMLIYDITFGLKLYEVTPYITDTTFSNNIEIITMNLKKWNSLTKEDQGIFLDVVKELEPWNMKETLSVVEKFKGIMTSKGAKIHTLTAGEKKLYLKDSYSLWPEVEKVSGPRGKQFMQILKKYR
ncbi:MAG: TRAP transporter substrate-binding protein DctP [Deltaproteobacteria bacterium]|nr:TRAP transporter substrate-binding protein DctP [Deltaproteobacteria bacterium]MBW1943380.1 TRAP transporter substrate-binding protein DctP [Deltaproteobacteria bacterium]